MSGFNYIKYAWLFFFTKKNKTNGNCFTNIIPFKILLVKKFKKKDFWKVYCAFLSWMMVGLKKKKVTKTHIKEGKPETKKGWLPEERLRIKSRAKMPKKEKTHDRWNPVFVEGISSYSQSKESHLHKEILNS